MRKTTKKKDSCQITARNKLTEVVNIAKGATGAALFSTLDTNHK